MSKIQLRTDNNHYVCAEGGGGQGVVANRVAAGPWETFELVDLGNSKVALKASNGQYVCAEDGGGQSVVANRGAVGSWETFSLIDAGNGKVSLKTSNGHYLCAEDGGGQAFVANRGAVGSWETFKIINVSQSINTSQKKLTIKSVKCIRPSSGIDDTTRAVFGTIGGIAAGGVAIAGTTVTGGALLGAVSLAVISGSSGGVTLANTLGHCFSGSDDLYIKVNGGKVWPSDGDVDIDSQQQKDVNVSVNFTGKVTIELMDYDSASNDDSLGYMTIDTSNMTAPIEDRWIVQNAEEGSLYEIYCRVE
jgi:Fascin domain